MRKHIATRRAVIKATGALGTIATLAVPVAVLPTAEAVEPAPAFAAHEPLPIAFR